jgi:hypothetical protein
MDAPSIRFGVERQVCRNYTCTNSQQLPPTCYPSGAEMRPIWQARYRCSLAVSPVMHGHCDNGGLVYDCGCCLQTHLPIGEVYCQLCQHMLYPISPLPSHNKVVYVNLDEPILVLVELNFWKAKVARESNIMDRILSFEAQPILAIIFESGSFTQSCIKHAEVDERATMEAHSVGQKCS